MLKKEVLSALIDPKKIAILQVLLHSKDELYLKEVAAKSKVPLATTYRILQELCQQDLVHRKEWKTSKVYSCHNNPKISFLRTIFTEEFDGLQEFLDQVKSLSGLQNVFLHGISRKNMANVLLIGENLETQKVESLCSELKTKGFELSYLVLTKDQYTQMSKMGFYSGDKKILI